MLPWPVADGVWCCQRRLIVGVDLDIEAGPIVNKGYERGILLVSAGPNVVRFVPPLTITEEEVDEVVARLGRVLGVA